jgi:hypothetical protein
VKTRNVGFVIAGLAAGLMLGSPAANTSAEVTGPAQIRITNQELSVRRIDVDAPGRGPGDMEIIRQSLFNRRVRARAIGHAELLCTYVNKRARSCNGTYFLPRGRLEVAGALRFRLFYELAVVGGTGLYNDARGTLVVTRTHTRPNRDFVLFRLAG